MTNMKKSPLSLSELFASARAVCRLHQCGGGIAWLLLSMFALALISGMNMPAPGRIFVAGEIADRDVVAHRDLLVEDSQATHDQRERLLSQQPTVFDLSTAELAGLREQVGSIIKEINQITQAGQIEGLNELRQKFSTRFNTPVSLESLTQWAQPDVQDFVLTVALPWFEGHLADGVVADSRQSLAASGGVLIRNLENGSEILRTDSRSLPDLAVVLAQFSQIMRRDPGLSNSARKAIDSLFAVLIKPTLTINREATKSLGSMVTQTLKPVFYHLRKGEVVVYQGERISRETQLKLQSLFRRVDGGIQARTVAGAFTLALLLALGLFMAPSGKPGSLLRRKDLHFIALLLLITGLLAKGLQLIGAHLVEPQMLPFVAYCFPLAASAGLSALIFAARRYCVVGLLLSFFATLMFKASLPLFLFFYIAAMLNTWFIIRAQTRQDVVWSVLPLAVGQVIIAVGSGWLDGMRGADEFLILSGFVCLNALLSLFILFAISPILEIAFGYTTRFRLMELMNLEQPLLQDLMVTIPGTYHHSLVVANMVEAGAKAVGANSLLCKVAALYHDVGKLAYPDYFIENQFGGPNRHDKLAPAMSALILGSHVKKGTDLAQKYRVGEEIEEIIRQHHGTGLIRYFYKKAQDMGDNPRMEDFCYPGPKPQTREAAIVMLADAVEASSRTLTDPTPARIKNHIETIMKGIFADGQLDESDLTFKELHKLTENFARILTGLFHQRIVYPENIKPRVELPPSPVEPDNSPLPLVPPLNANGWKHKTGSVLPVATVPTPQSPEILLPEVSKEGEK